MYTKNIYKKRYLKKLFFLYYYFLFIFILALNLCIHLVTLMSSRFSRYIPDILIHVNSIFLIFTNLYTAAAKYLFRGAEGLRAP